tara:strand:+ start:1123 stop:2100 length:978 start_codon:yes stop_codon:yes gene_type:complete
MSKKIIVIGSSSFSGSWMVKELIKNKFNVTGISRSKIKREFLFFNEKEYNFHQLDINKQFKKITNLIDKIRPSIIINFAAQSFVRTSWETPEDWFKTNTYSSIKLANYLKDKKFLKKFIQISTPEIYGNISNFRNNSYHSPTTPYALSKSSFDKFLTLLFNKYKFPVIFVRSANVYGEGQQLYRIIPKAIIKIKNNEKLFLNDKGEIYRSFIHIEDNSKIILKIINKGKLGSVYHPSTNNLISLKILAKIICKNLNSSYSKHIRLTSKVTTRDKYYNIFSKKELNQLKFKKRFIDIETGIIRVIEWINSNWKKFSNQKLEYIHKK